MPGKLGYGAGVVENNSFQIKEAKAFCSGFNIRVKEPWTLITDCPFSNTGNGVNEYDAWRAGWNLAEAGKTTTVTPPVYVGGPVLVPATWGTVPNILGMTGANADTAITTAGFIKGTVTGTTGPVIAQSPGPGVKAVLGSAINYTLTA